MGESGLHVTDLLLCFTPSFWIHIILDTEWRLSSFVEMFLVWYSVCVHYLKKIKSLLCVHWNFKVIVQSYQLRNHFISTNESFCSCSVLLGNPASGLVPCFWCRNKTSNKMFELWNVWKVFFWHTVNKTAAPSLPDLRVIGGEDDVSESNLARRLRLAKASRRLSQPCSNRETKNLLITDPWLVLECCLRERCR